MTFIRPPDDTETKCHATGSCEKPRQQTWDAKPSTTERLPTCNEGSLNPTVVCPDAIHEGPQDGLKTPPRGTPLYALSVRQPWAWLIAHGFKSFENNLWSFGPGLGHADAEPLPYQPCKGALGFFRPSIPQ